LAVNENREKARAKLRRLKSEGIIPRYSPPRAEEKCPSLVTLIPSLEALPVDEHPYKHEYKETST